MQKILYWLALNFFEFSQKWGLISTKDKAVR